MEIKKNDVFLTTIEDMSDDGAGIGKTNGYTWFIKDTVIGDVVEAAAMKMKKSYGYGRLIRVVEPSAARVEPACPVARQCGGCQLQAMSYEEQLRFKENKVFHNLTRIGRLRTCGGLVTAQRKGDWENRAWERQREGKRKTGIVGIRRGDMRNFCRSWAWRIHGGTAIRVSFLLAGIRTGGR